MERKSAYTAPFLVGLLILSLVSGLPVASADEVSEDIEIERQQPETVNVSSQLRSANGTVTVIARLDTPQVSATTGNSTAKRQLKSFASRTQRDLANFAQTRHGVDIVNRFWITNAVVLEINTSRIDLTRIASIEGVRKIHPNYDFEMPMPEPPNATSRVAGSSLGASTQATQRLEVNATYGLKQINALKVWRQFDSRGAGAKVAVLDTGVNVSHPAIDLFTRDPGDPTYPGGWAEFDTVGRYVYGSTPHAVMAHGMHTSGTVSGNVVERAHVNGRIVQDLAVGVAPEVKLMHGLVPELTFAQIIAGMQWAVSENADVISMSFGAQLPAGRPSEITPLLMQPVENAMAAGTLVVVSSGNSGYGSIGTPASLYTPLSVGASTPFREVPAFSSGATVTPTDVWTDVPDDWPSKYIYPDLVAPGVRVLSSVPGGYARYPGTSMAAPHVAGAAALLLSATDEPLSPREIIRVFKRTADKPAGMPVAQDPRYGTGIIDVYEAVVAVRSDATITGTVQYPNGTAVPQVEVSTASGVINTTTGPAGSFRLAVPVGTHTVSVDIHSPAKFFGYRPVSEQVAVDSNQTKSVTLEVNPAVDVRSIRRSDLANRGAEMARSLQVAHLDRVTLNRGPDMTIESSKMTVYVEGRPVSLGETINMTTLDDVTDLEIRVETPVRSGVINFSLVLHGPGENVTVPFIAGASESENRVGIVDIPSGEQGNKIQRELWSSLPFNYTFDVISTPDSAEIRRLADEYDVLVLQRLSGDKTISAILNRTSESGTGLVVLGGHAPSTSQRSDDARFADAITRLSMVSGNPEPVFSGSYPNTRLGQSKVLGAPVNYTIITDHPIFNGVGSVGDTVTAYGTWRGYGLPAWIGNYTGETLARTAVDGTIYGPGIAVSESGDRVLMTLGLTPYVGIETADSKATLSNASVRMLANAIQFSDPVSVKSDRFVVTSLSVSAQSVSSGESVTVTATVKNVGELAGTQLVEYHLNGGTALHRTLTLAAGENATVTFTIETNRLPEGVYGHGVYTREDAARTELKVTGHSRPTIVRDQPATNADDDPLLEDVDGDGTVTFEDAITLAFNTDTASQYPQYFDFDNDGDVDFDDAVALAFM